MPELPEVETVKRGLAPVMEMATVSAVEQNRPNLRFPFPDGFCERVTGKRITSLWRRAKYLLADLDGGETLVMHLGMSGSFRIEMEDEQSQPGVFHHPKDKNSKHDHVVFHVQGKNGNARVIYNDPRRFGFMDLVATSILHEHPWFANLGVEPTGNILGGAVLAPLFDGKTAPLKAALLDQRLIAGLGNIYVCEALWRSGLSPKRAAKTLVLKSGKPSRRLNDLALHIRETIDEAIQAGGSSLKDHRQANGDLGYFQHRFAVYDRKGETCAHETCNGIVERIVQSGRSSFFCPKCQK